MEKTKKRAHRRFHNARMLRRAKRMIIETFYWDPSDIPDEKELHVRARWYRDDMCKCSCSGCGNPRRGYWNGRRERMTMPERKAEDSFLDQLAEIEYDG